MKEDPSPKRKNFQVICLGNFVDFLEFGLFSAMLPFISRELFPDISAFSRTTLSYFIVYVGFLGRPIGGLFLGRLGDLKGPYFVFTLSVVGISLASGLLAFVPISALSAAFLVTLRFFQGFFTGAEQATAMICASSNLEKNSSHTRIVFVTMSGIIGVAFAQVIAYSLSVLAPNRVGVWRELFVLISFLSIGVFIRDTYAKNDNVLSLRVKLNRKDKGYGDV